MLVEVRLRDGIADPQGATIERALPALGLDGVTGVRAGKAFRFDIAAADEAEALARATVVADRLLANPVIEESTVTVPGGASGPGLMAAARRRGDVSRAPTASTTPSWPLQRLGASADLVWHGDTTVAGYDALILPGGFAHGDYLRPGAIARFSPVMEAVGRFAADGGPVVGICNGFQVLTEAGLLPGALQKNRGLRFLCTTVEVRVESSDSVLTAGGARRHRAAHPHQPLRGQLHLRRRHAGRAPGRGPGGAPLRGQPQRIGRRHRRRLQRGPQRGRPHAPSRAGLGSPARLGRRDGAAGGPAGLGRRSDRAAAGERGVGQRLSRRTGPGSAGLDGRAGPAGCGQLRVRGIFACWRTEALTPTVRQAE